MVRLSDYKIIIVDLDGTLYFQKPVRFRMLLLMLLHPHRMMDFLTVRKYRKLYAERLGEKERLARLPANASEVISEWMIRRPLPYIKKYSDLRLLSVLRTSQEQKIRVAVYSDYPVYDKLKALNFFPREAFCADEIGSMKPDASGIIKSMNLATENIQNILVIGDRDDRDGELARNIGCDYLILSGSGTVRREQYQF